MIRKRTASHAVRADGPDTANRTDKDTTCPLSVRPVAAEATVHPDKPDVLEHFRELSH
jgi:hypothetical protein